MNKQERERVSTKHMELRCKEDIYEQGWKISVIINYNPSPTKRDKKVNTYLSVM